MRNILFFVLGFLVLIPVGIGLCDETKISGAMDEPTLLSPTSEQIIKEEWAKANELKALPQYSPSSVSVDEVVLREKPLMASDRALSADEKNNAIESKLSSVADLPKEFDQIVSLSGKMKLFDATRHLAVALGRCSSRG